MSVQEADRAVELGLLPGVIVGFNASTGEGQIETNDGQRLTFYKSHFVEPVLDARQYRILLNPANSYVKFGAKVLFSAASPTRVRQWCLVAAFNVVNKAYKKLPLYRLTQKVTRNDTPFADPKTRSWVTPTIVTDEVLWIGRNLFGLTMFLQRRQHPSAVFVELVYEVLQDGFWIKCNNPLLQEGIRSAI